MNINKNDNTNTLQINYYPQIEHPITPLQMIFCTVINTVFLLFKITRIYLLSDDIEKNPFLYWFHKESSLLVSLHSANNWVTEVVVIGS